MPKLRHPLTPQIISQISAGIRAGGFPWISAQAAGIPLATFQEWLANARKPNPKKIYQDLMDAIHTAEASARLHAEITVARQDPKTWLRCGPGREKNQRPGWTRPGATMDIMDEYNALIEKHTMLTLTRILVALRPFPEARRAVAEVLECKKKQNTTATQRSHNDSRSAEKTPDSPVEGLPESSTSPSAPSTDESTACAE